MHSASLRSDLSCADMLSRKRGVARSQLMCVAFGNGQRRRDKLTTAKSSSEKSRAVARPMPELAPVIKSNFMDDSSDRKPIDQDRMTRARSAIRSVVGVVPRLHRDGTRTSAQILRRWRCEWAATTHRVREKE